MSGTRIFAAITLTAVLTGALVAGLCLSRPARAESPRTAVCQTFFAKGFTAESPKFTEAPAAWMTSQLAEGRTNFVSLGAVPGLCAW